MKKRFLLLLALVSLISVPMATAQSITSLQSGLGTFAEKVTASLPFAAGAGIDWSDAYIGPLLGGDFPFLHLGVGANVGLTTIPGTAISPLLEALGHSKLEVLPLPYAVANARIGGIILPFDVGLKVGFIPENLKTAVAGYTFDYQNFGLDVRYNVLRSNILLPDISVGAGVNFLKAAVSADIGSGKTYTNPYNGAMSLNVSAPKVAIDLEAMSFEAKAQISKTILWIITPYVGVGASLGTSKAKAGVTASITPTGSTLTEWEQFLGPLSSVGFSKTGNASPISLKAFGGASLNIFILKLDVQGMYNLTDGAMGGSVGLRAQI